ncbi:MAG: hypothetical protein Q9159_001163 [Coniocarpon cinnabarinum]
MSSSRHSPAFSQAVIAVLTFAGVVAGLAAFYTYRQNDHEASRAAQNLGLQRAGAIRRPRRPPESQSSVNPQPEIGNELVTLDGAVSEHEGQRNGIDGGIEAREHDAETEHSIPDEDAAQVAENQSTESKLKELTYFIAQNRELECGIVHRAASDHPRTHVFYKIRVPCFWGPGKAEPVWYPGTPHKMPHELPDELLHEGVEAFAAIGLHEATEAKVKGLYVQFTCLADTALRAAQERDPIGYGITPANFRYLLPVTQRGALVMNRLFAILDEDKDRLLSFSEFIRGTVLILHRRKHPKYRSLLFKAWDLDEDGFVSRQDLLRLFDSMHEIAEDISICHLKLYDDSDDQRRIQEGRTLRDHLESTKPLPNFFSTAYLDQLHLHRVEGAMFNQLTGNSSLPNDDGGGRVLFQDSPMFDSSRTETVDDDLATPAAQYIHKHLRSAFNEVVDNICGYLEQRFACTKRRRPFRMRHARFLDQIRVKKIALAGRFLPDVPEESFDRTLFTHSHPDSESLRGEIALTSVDWQTIEDCLGINALELVCETIDAVYSDSRSRNGFIQDLRNMLEDPSAIGEWDKSVEFQEAWARHQAASWNPSFRHNTLDIYPGLLLPVLSPLMEDLAFEHYAERPEKWLNGELTESAFWNLAQKAAQQRGGDDLDYIPMLDVLGLVVI